ncbi:hypothetical protein GCM10022233_03960 [Streptomyces shaanxiensis]|uniref:Uncharacterized protein n=1 Tax=Streptomyces shaanxiensis TaxID=653357 RepID=A0ABP7UCC7_9ACTN
MGRVAEVLIMLQRLEGEGGRGLADFGREDRAYGACSAASAAADPGARGCIDMRLRRVGATSPHPPAPGTHHKPPPP